MRGLLAVPLALALGYVLTVIAALVAYPRFGVARWIRDVLALEGWVSDTFWGTVGWLAFWSR